MFVAVVLVAVGVGIGVAAGARPGRVPGAPASAAASDDDRFPTPAATSPTATTALGDHSVQTTGAPLDPEAPAEVDHIGDLRRGLASEDEAARIAAVRSAVRATALETLPELQKFDLARDPETAPTVIHAVAKLGARADGKRRDEAARTLSTWLRSEMRREGGDVLGNVSNIVEALGTVGGSEAVDALGAALDRRDLPLAVEVLAVSKLGELGDPRARGPVERFAARAGALPPAEGIDEELRVEAIGVARTALSNL